MRSLVASALATLIPVLTLAAGPTFTIIDLGPGPASFSTHEESGWGLSWARWQCAPNYNIPPLYGSDPAYLCSVNPHAEVGYTAVAPSPNDEGILIPIVHAYLFQLSASADGPTTDLGALGVGASSYAYSANFQVTAVVGASGTVPLDVPHSQDHAFIWQPSTGMRDLGTFTYYDPSLYDSMANDVNDALQVVGYSRIMTSSGVAMRAALWQNGQLYELQYQIVGVPVASILLTSAVGISCTGQIAAVGYPASDQSVSHNYLLQPTQPHSCN